MTEPEPEPEPDEIEPEQLFDLSQPQPNLQLEAVRRYINAALISLGTAADGIAQQATALAEQQAELAAQQANLAEQQAELGSVTEAVDYLIIDSLGGL